MALDHAALLEVLEAMKSAGVDERVKVAAQTVYQALTRLNRQLRQRASSDAWMKPTDRLWLQHWADVVTHHGRTGGWPKSNGTDPVEKMQAGWLGFQRKQYRKQRLSPEREAMMRAAGVRFTEYRGYRAVEDDAQ